MVTIVLHVLKEKSKDTYTPPGYVDEIDENGEIFDGSWRNDAYPSNIAPVPGTRSCHVGRSATEIRNSLLNYFITVGCDI